MSEEAGVKAQSLGPAVAQLASSLQAVQGLLDACLETYRCLLLVVREFIDAQLKALEEARALSQPRREKVKVE